MWHLDELQWNENIRTYASVRIQEAVDIKETPDTAGRSRASSSLKTSRIIIFAESRIRSVSGDPSGWSSQSVLVDVHILNHGITGLCKGAIYRCEIRPIEAGFAKAVAS